jgi:hypothetical protein
MSIQVAVAPAELNTALTERLSEQKQALVAAADWLNQNAPEVRDNIISAADKNVEGLLLISGSNGEPIFAGNPPEWKEIRSNDSHYGSDLHRMPHWRNMLKAFLLTNEARYAERVVLEVLDWIEKCPRPELPKKGEKGPFGGRFYGVSAEDVPWHCLNSGIRLFETWRFLLEVLVGTEYLSPENLMAVGLSMREQAEAIRAVSPNLFPDAHHNHYLMEMLGVLTYSRLFPELPDSEEWAKHAAGELDRCAISQLTEKGAQVEGCPSYHNGCMWWFLLARKNAEMCGAPLSSEADARIRRGIDYAIHASRPSGEDVPWGDSHAGTGFITSAVWAQIAFDDWEPLAQVCKYVNTERVVRVAAENVWDVPDIADMVERIKSGTVKTDAQDWLLIEHQEEIKQVALRTAWSPDALNVFFGAYSPVHYGNHGHIDPCGFEFSAYGKALLIDPGSCPYYESELRRQIKSASGHNMLTINFREPFDYCGSFAYMPQKEGGIDWVLHDERIMAVQGNHMNYEPTKHRRCVAIIDSKYLLVLDELTELFWLSSAQVYYQFPFDAISELPDGSGIVSNDAEQNVAVITTENLTLRTNPYTFHAVNKDDPTQSEQITTVRFDDPDYQQSHLTTRAYASLVVPLAEGESLPEVSRPVMSGSPEAWTVNFSIAGEEYSLGWLSDSLKIS